MAFGQRDFVVPAHAVRDFSTTASISSLGFLSFKKIQMGIGRISNCLQDEWAHAFFFYCWIISSRQQLPSLLLPTPQKICHTADDDSILDSKRSKSSRNWLTVQPTKEVALYKENTKLKRKRFFVHRNLYFVVARCLKITENVSFNIASEASLLKMTKMLHLASFEKHEDCGQTVLPDRSVL